VSDPQLFILADDHPLLRQALVLTLVRHYPAVRCVEAATAEQLGALLAIEGETADLLLLDLAMPGAQGLSPLLMARQEHPSLPVLVISAHDDSDTVAAVRALGAAGFWSKAQAEDTLVAAVAAVCEGRSWFTTEPERNPVASRLASLTPQQLRILQLFAAGLLNKQIAYDLGIEEATVKAHATAIFRKLGVHNRTQAVILLQQLRPEDTFHLHVERSAS